MAPITANAALPPLHTNAGVDLTPVGALSNGDIVGAPAVSADGRYVVFASRATNLTAEPSTGKTQVYRRDVVTNTTTLISRSGPHVGNADSVAPEISDDGQTIAYLSAASNLAVGSGGETQQALIWSSSTGESKLISSSWGVLHSSNAKIDNVDLAGGGEYVVFQTRADDLIPTDLALTDIPRAYKWSEAGGVTLVAANFGLEVDSPSVSDDGRFVAFRSYMDHLLPDVEHSESTLSTDIYFRDTVMGSTQRATVGPTAGFRLTAAPSISGNGQYVAYSGNRSIFGSAPDGNTESYLIFTFDRLSGATTNETFDLPFRSYSAFLPSLSRDGSKLSFSVGTNLDLAGRPYKVQVFSRDRASRVTTLVSQSRIGEEGNANSEVSSMSADGRFVAFSSKATNLSPAGGVGRNQLLIRSLG
ncbi:MAG: hypothetical protein Q7T71_09750 [Herbiconiux sp.]|nr:hypothetical protein [Herbiconiux sp.]